MRRASGPDEENDAHGHDRDRARGAPTGSAGALQRRRDVHRRTSHLGELGANVDRAGNAFRSLGIQREQRILILTVDSPAFVYALFGAIKSGAIPIPYNWVLPPRDLLYALNDSRAIAIVVSASLLPKVLEVRAQAPHLRHVLVTTSGTPPLEGALPSGVVSFEEALAAADDELDPVDTTPDEACFWLY
ncbi:MAG: AMP-binding protein, partial [Chloroflexi bacterium]|nr:AMP-binding protein [Chloroflexota bacterium]